MEAETFLYQLAESNYNTDVHSGGMFLLHSILYSIRGDDYRLIALVRNQVSAKTYVCSIYVRRPWRKSIERSLINTNAQLREMKRSSNQPPEGSLTPPSCHVPCQGYKEDSHGDRSSSG